MVISDAATKIQRFFRNRVARKRNSKAKKHTFSFGGTSHLKPDEMERRIKPSEVKQLSPEKLHEDLLRQESLDKDLLTLTI